MKVANLLNFEVQLEVIQNEKKPFHASSRITTLQFQKLVPDAIELGVFLKNPFETKFSNFTL